MNDGTIEVNAFKPSVVTVQFHPDGNGPTKDTGYLYDGFMNTIKDKKGRSPAE